MKKLSAMLAPMVPLALALTLVSPAAAVGDAGPVEARYGTGSFAVTPNVTLPASGCVNHPYVTTVHIGNETDSWYVDVTVHDPDGGIAGGYEREVSDDEWGTVSIDDDVTLCVGTDDPGAYRITGSLFTMNEGSSTFVEQQLASSVFTLGAPGGATPARADVTGKVSTRKVARGVRLGFTTHALPAGTVAADKLTWTVLLDGKVRRTFSQGPSASKNVKITSPARTGKHVVKVLRNGKAVKTVRYRA